MGAPIRFDRAVRLEVTDPDDLLGTRVEYGKGLGLRMRFDILKTNDLQANTGQIQIYNLNETTRGEISGKVKRDTLLPTSVESGTSVTDAERTAGNMGFAYARLFAGYGSAPEQILEGAASHVESNRAGLDWITTMHFGDSENSLRAALASKVFAPGTRLTPVLQYLVDTLGVATAPGFQLKILAALAKTGGRADFPKGISLQGPSRELLSQLLQLLDLRAQVTDGEMTVLDRDGAIDVAPLLVTDLSGLLEAPIPLENDTYALVSDLEPQFAPGRLVTVATTTLAGTFVVDQVRHRGDTHGNNFRSRTELRTLGVSL